MSDSNLKVLSNHYNYYLKMISNNGIKKLIKVDMKYTYYNVDDIYDKMNNYVQDNVCWKIIDNEKKIYMCKCSDTTSRNYFERSVNKKYSRYTIWFIKLREKLNPDNIIYLSTADVKIFPKDSFKEVFNNVNVPEGFEISDYQNLYICNI